MFSESAHLYDAIYRAFEDYAAEATAISALVRAAHPSARTVLDVGCGTGSRHEGVPVRYEHRDEIRRGSCGA